jgi:hypothetical protein
MNALKPAFKKQKTSAKASPSSSAVPNTNGDGDDGQPSQNALERPPGKKKEKQRLKQRSTMEAIEYLVEKKKEADVEKDSKKEDRCKKAFALQEERIRIERENVAMKREMEEERIMHMDLSIHAVNGTKNTCKPSALTNC